MDKDVKITTVTIQGVSHEKRPTDGHTYGQTDRQIDSRVLVIGSCFYPLCIEP